jgi:ABC-type multidrug transport system ATPase subunit
MQRLARGGRTIICVIHQPSSSIFEMFDQLYLLAKGECIYQGPTTNVINFIYQATGIKCPSYHSPVYIYRIYSKSTTNYILTPFFFSFLPQADFGTLNQF